MLFGPWKSFECLLTTRVWASLRAPQLNYSFEEAEEKSTLTRRCRNELSREYARDPRRDITMFHFSRFRSIDELKRLTVSNRPITIESNGNQMQDRRSTTEQIDHNPSIANQRAKYPWTCHFFQNSNRHHLNREWQIACRSSSKFWHRQNVSPTLIIGSEWNERSTSSNEHRFVCTTRRYCWRRVHCICYFCWSYSIVIIIILHRTHLLFIVLSFMFNWHLFLCGLAVHAHTCRRKTTLDGRSCLILADLWLAPLFRSVSLNTLSDLRDRMLSPSAAIRIHFHRPDLIGVSTWQSLMWQSVRGDLHSSIRASRTVRNSLSLLLSEARRGSRIIIHSTRTSKRESEMLMFANKKIIRLTSSVVADRHV